MPSPYFDFQTAAGAERRRFEWPEGTTETVVGRASECGWVISSNAVSRRHARLVRRGGEVWIEDLGSSNGTFVNGERLTEPRALRDQDRVQLGTLEATFVAPPPEVDGDATIAVVSRPSAPPEPSAPTAAEPRPTKGGTGTHTVASPPPPPPPPEPAVRAEAEAPPPAPAPPLATPAGIEAAAAPPRPIVVPRSIGGEGAPSVPELALIAAGSFLLVFLVGAVLIRFVF